MIAIANLLVHFGDHFGLGRRSFSRPHHQGFNEGGHKPLREVFLVAVVEVEGASGVLEQFDKALHSWGDAYYCR